MKISVVVDNASWIIPYAKRLVQELASESHQASFCASYADILEGDIAFLLGCISIAPPEILRRNKHNLIVHESALPKGRGFSPVTWQVLEGSNRIPIRLIEAAEQVDSGAIYLSDEIELSGYELINDIRGKQGSKTIALCKEFVSRYSELKPTEQTGEVSSYPRRTPKDSRLDPDKTIREQFNLLRVVDNERYPAFFEIDGHRYILRIEQDNE